MEVASSNRTSREGAVLTAHRERRELSEPAFPDLPDCDFFRRFGLRSGRSTLTGPQSNSHRLTVIQESGTGQALEVETRASKQAAVEGVVERQPRRRLARLLLVR